MISTRAQSLVCKASAISCFDQCLHFISVIVLVSLHICHNRNLAQVITWVYFWFCQNVSWPFLFMILSSVSKKIILKSPFFRLLQNKIYLFLYFQHKIDTYSPFLGYSYILLFNFYLFVYLTLYLFIVST